VKGLLDATSCLDVRDDEQSAGNCDRVFCNRRNEVPHVCLEHCRTTDGDKSNEVKKELMRRTLGTDMQGHEKMKDAQQILRHASIKTTAEIYMQEIEASVRSAINSGTREIFSQRTKELSQLGEPVFSPEEAQFSPTPEHNGSKRFQVRLWGICKWLKRMAPQVGLEPTTLRLTAGCSADRPLILKGVIAVQRHDNRCSFWVLLDNRLDNFRPSPQSSNRTLSINVTSPFNCDSVD
jgi:hypothetical protein